MPSAPPIEALLPHRGRMRLVDALAAQEPGAVRTHSRVTEDWPLHSPAGVDSLLLVEVMAQSTAVLASVAAEPGAPPAAGLLVGLRDVWVQGDALRPGLDVETRVELLWERGPLRAYRGEVFAAAATLARATLHIMTAPTGGATQDRKDAT